MMDAKRSLGDVDIYLFKQGRHTRLYEHFGAHPESLGPNSAGTRFVVWAPNASFVSVVGDFNEWDRTKAPMSQRADSSGVWECFVPEARHGQRYKYLLSWPGGSDERADPFALFCEHPPATASIIWGPKARMLQAETPPCAPCFRHACHVEGHPCLAGIGPSRVWEALLGLIPA